MVRQFILDKVRKLKTFSQFARYFVQKKCRPDVLLAPLVAYIKDSLSILKKRKYSKYRLDYQQYRLRQMEELIAKNSSHYFLNNRKIDEFR